MGDQGHNHLKGLGADPSSGAEHYTLVFVYVVCPSLFASLCAWRQFQRRLASLLACLHARSLACLLACWLACRALSCLGPHSHVHQTTLVCFPRVPSRFLGHWWLFLFHA
jgi:hypothetical protein